MKGGTKQKMKIEQNTLSRDWTITHNGRTFFVNLTESDGQTLRLCNRDNWQIIEQTDHTTKELHPYTLRNSSQKEQKQADANATLIDQLIAHCIRNWQNPFMQELQANMKIQQQRIDT